MTRFRIVVAIALAVVVGVPSAYAQHRGGGRARGGGVVVGRAVPRGQVRTAPRGYAAPRYVRAAPVRFYQPYYAFRPRFSLGFGLWLGYPVRYTSYYGYYNPYYYPSYPYPYPYGYAYPSPYGYPYPSAYPAYPPPAYPPATYPPNAYPPSAYPQSGYPPQGSISPSQTNTGGMSFEIQPSNAQLYVDGRYVGTVGQFTPTTQPLGLTAGHHHIQITAPGYRTMDFEVDIVAGEVIPYQGTLQP
jgi:hypothetical protein